MMWKAARFDVWTWRLYTMGLLLLKSMLHHKHDI